MIGGFPCQGFSIANPNRKSTGMKDERNFLYLEMLFGHNLCSNIDGQFKVGNVTQF